MLSIVEILKVVFLGIVEGVTEWLPISSTGHMLLVDEFIQIQASKEFKEMFFVVIQLGAILAVILLFWKKMWPFQMKDKSKPVCVKETFSLWFKVVVACIPWYRFYHRGTLEQDADTEGGEAGRYHI